MNMEYGYWIYVLTLPLMWFLATWVRIKIYFYRIFGFGEPKINTIWFDGLGVRNALIRSNAKCFRAMDVIYDYHLAQGNFFDRLWIGMRNAQAVRNRGRKVRELLLDVALSSGSAVIRLLSLACGSARDVIDVIVMANNKGVTVKAMLVDINPDALNAAQEYAEKCGVSDQVEFLQSDIMTVWPAAKEFAPNVVHIIGLLEYVPNERAINLLAAVHAVLQGGKLLTSNTVNNMEAGFLRYVIGWNMLYRSGWQLERLLKAAGFKRVVVHSEPHKIQNIVVAD